MDLRKYLLLIQNSIHNNGLIMKAPPTPIEIVHYKYKKIVGIRATERNIYFENDHRLKYTEDGKVINGEKIEITDFSYHFQPEKGSICKQSGYWPFRVDKNSKQGLHANHEKEGNPPERWNSSWPHELREGIHTALILSQFCLAVAIQVVLNYIKNKTEYPLNPNCAQKYNTIIADTVRRLK